MLTWREKRRIREEGVERTLPSGMTARLRGIPLDVFILRGNIPDALTDVIVKAATGEGDTPLGDFQTLKEAQGYFELLNEITTLCFAWPHIVNDPQTDDEITIDDVDMIDKAYLLEYLGKPASALMNFPKQEESSAGLEPVLSGEGHVPNAVGRDEYQSVLEEADRA